MRIVSGRWRGRALASPPGLATRPTSDRARQALFDVLAHAPWAPALEGARVIDLFAGSGALGFEALSRGAASCLFVETDEAARGAIRDNADALGALGCTRVHRRDATDLGPRPASAGEAFRLAFLDPPYTKGLGERARGRLARAGRRGRVRARPRRARPRAPGLGDPGRPRLGRGASAVPAPGSAPYCALMSASAGAGQRSTMASPRRSSDSRSVISYTCTLSV